MNSPLTAEAKTALVTGANGFVGQPLCAAMHMQEWRIKAALRLPHQITAGVEPVLVGVVDGETDWTDALFGVKVVIHLAARVHVMKDVAVDPLAEFRKVNLYGTANLARQAARADVQRPVHVSSVKVNGESTATTTNTPSFNPLPSKNSIPENPIGHL